MDEVERYRYLAAGLREELYDSFFCHGYPVSARWGEPQPPSGDPWLVTQLSEANTGQGSWETGWTVESVEGRNAVVAGARLRARVPLSDCRAASTPPRRGQHVSLRLPKELPERSPGFYTVVSDAPAGFRVSDALVRVYWNISRSGAARLVGLLTSRLNAQGAPFQLKVADHDVRLSRCDAAVLYVAGVTFEAVGGLLRDVADILGAALRPRIPAFTLEFAPGVGLAEDVGNGQSFGLRRCALLADGIVRAYARGARHGPARLAEVESRFAEDGVRIDAPYLEPSLAGRHVL